jgi:hypothetical protein
MPAPIPLLRLAVSLIILVVAQTLATAPVAFADGSRPVTIRIRWGGGTPQAWGGRIEVLPSDAGPPPKWDWRMLSTQPDAAAAIHQTDNRILVSQPHPTANDGVELTVHEWHRARLAIAFGPATTGQPSVTVDLPLAEILAASWQRPLDDDGNRLVIEQPVGDALRVALSNPDAPADATSPPTSTGSLWRPGGRVRVLVTPLLLMKPGGGDVEVRVRLSPARQETVLESRVLTLAGGSQPPDMATRSGQVPTLFAPVDCELTLPADEGAYDIVLDAVERRGMRWNRELARTKVQVVAIASEPPPRAVDEPWKILHDLDPGSPRLHERLRRLPARGFQAMPRAAVAFPAVPMPSFPRPSLSMPRMADMPLPDVSSLVPRLGGLLASGHSTVVPHPLGAMLRLPQAASAKSPAWEGIVIATAQPGMPHVVEIDYPSDQRATVAACVLEADAAGSGVKIRHAGGFDVAAAAHDGPATLSTYRFVFWPTTRQPLLVIANPLTTGPALVGHVRVLAGPTRLPKASTPKRPMTHRHELRRTFAVLPTIDLTEAYGGLGVVAPDAARTTTDWVSHLTAIRHSADTIAAQGLAGGVVPVYAGGAAAWPSIHTRSPARWAPADAIDGPTHDLLSVAAHVYVREGLAFVPALCFDSAMPALESLRMGIDATGITCVGADGRPRKIPGGIHYNILDPRVQQAVEELVGEAADRLSDLPGVAGMALLLPDTGWLHLPGIAWGLDDVTFGRFVATMGGAESETGGDRFAIRAKLVTGGLRNEWLAWRTGEVSAFYSRLAARIGARDGRTLFVVPTTLLATGELASRFRPVAGPSSPQSDLLREIGLVASLPPGQTSGDIIFMPPHVFAGGTSLADRSTVTAANLAGGMAVAAAGVTPRAAAVLLRPLQVNLAEILPHGPFPAATLPQPCQAWIEPSAPSGDPCLAQALVTADAEVMFDMRGARGAPLEGPTTLKGTTPRVGLDALPAIPFEMLATAAAPLVVRTRTVDGTTWVQLVNAGPAPVDAVLGITGPAVTVVNVANGESLAIANGRATVPLAAWDVRSLALASEGRLESAAALYSPATRAVVATSLEGLRQRLGVLAEPEPLDVLDNPGFELGIAEATVAGSAPAVTGWELLEPRRGAIELVPGLVGENGKGRAIRFSSRNGLSTVRSNPFGPPATGRVSVAAWLRLAPDEPQPPLRIAIEGVEGNREYYRFAAVGGLTGGRPLSPEWALFVLQVDDLPSNTVESLRVRFDLLGPGGVQIDEVRVFDLAFDEAQRGEIARQVARIDHRLKAGDVGGALLDLEGHWPAFLKAFVSDGAVAARARAEAKQQQPQAAAASPPEPEERQGMFDRLRGWW